MAFNSCSANNNIYTTDWTNQSTIIHISLPWQKKIWIYNCAASEPFVISAPLVRGGHKHPKNEVFQQIVDYVQNPNQNNQARLIRHENYNHFVCTNNESHHMNLGPFSKCATKTCAIYSLQWTTIGLP